jgi:hypothetical protein
LKRMRPCEQRVDLTSDPSSRNVSLASSRFAAARCIIALATEKGFKRAKSLAN